MSKYEELHIEQDFWNDFIVEAYEHIDEIENNAMSLEQHPEDMDIIHTMFRAFHTIKGLSGFVEHTIIQEIAHKTETMMDYCRKGELQVSTKIVDAILKSSDYVKQLCNDVDAYKDETLVDNIEKLLVVLEELSQVGNPFETAEPAAAVPAEPVVEVPEISAEEKALAEEQALKAFAEEVVDVKAEKEEIAEAEEKTPEAPPEEPIIYERPKAKKSKAKKDEEEQLQPEEPAKEEPIAVDPVVEEPVAEPIQEEVKALEESPMQEEVKAALAEEKVLTAAQSNIIEKLNAGGQAQPQKEEAPKEATAMKQQAASSEDYMKVANYRIDSLVDMISELIINQSLIEQYVFSKYSDDRQLTTNMSGFMRITRGLQHLSMSLRMVSLKSTFQKLARIARDTIQELNKDVEFIMTGENTEIDRVVAEKMLEPLVHMIKNAISHGIEPNPDDRVVIGKNRKARVELNAYNKRGKIFIEVKDDGRGINTEVVYQKALEKGLVDPNKTYSDAEIREFIMLPGFSTAAVVDNISGRGVGMDVVKTQILKSGGKIDIQSTLNQGSTFVLEVPVNHAIMNGTIIEMNEQQFVVPTLNVKEFLQASKDQWIYTKQERTMIKVREHIIPIVPLSVFFSDIKEEQNDNCLVMILELEQELRAVPITNVINRQEVVVKPAGEEFAELKYVSGMSILGTGKVSLILDIDYLFRKEVKNNG